MPESLDVQWVGDQIVVRKPHDSSFLKRFPRAWKPFIEAYRKGHPPSRVLRDELEKSNPLRLKDWLEFVREIEGSAPEDGGRLRQLREFDLAPGWFEHQVFAVKLWGERNLWARSYPGFYFLGFLTMALALVALGFDPRHFLWAGGSYDLAFVGLITGLAVLGLTKGAMLILMHLLATGSLPETRLAFRGLMLDLQVDVSPIEAHRLKLVKLFFFFTSAQLYLVGAALWSRIPLPGLTPSSLTVLALLMSFLGLNPRRRGEISKIFTIFYPQWKVRRALDHLENRALFRRGRWVSDESQLLGYALLCLLWSAGFIALLTNLVGANAGELWAAITGSGGGLAARISAVLAGLIFVGIVGVGALELWRLLVRHFSFLFQRPVRDFMRDRAVRTERHFDPAKIRQFLANSPLFQGAGERALDTFLGCGVIQIVRPGQSIIVQGGIGTELFLLLEGEAVVRRVDDGGEPQDLAVLSKGAVFGEMSLLRNTPRTASVVALSPLRVFVIEKAEFARIFQGESVREIERRIALSGVLGDSSVFQDLPSETLQVILGYGEFREFRRGEVLIEHGDREDKDFYIVLRGRVEAVRAGDMRLNEIGPAGFFGEVSLFENRPRSATIRALKDGVALKVSAEGFWRMVDQNPTLAAHIQELSWLRRETPDNAADSDS